MAILVLSPNGTYTTKTTLEAARTAADAADKTVVVTSALTQAQSSITAAWPTDRALEIKKGGSIADSTTFTINGPFSAGNYQVFAGSGAVTFGPQQDYVRPDWWVTNTTPGTTDMTTAINTAAVAARASSAVLKLSGAVYLVSNTVDFSRLNVTGAGTGESNRGTTIQATSAQFDVVLTDGNSNISDLNIYGGWDGTTAGQSGNGIKVYNSTNNTPFSVHLKNITIRNAKKNAIYIERGGYSSLKSVNAKISGLNGLELYGPSGSESITTISVDGSSIFSDAPNGYGIKITNGINIAVSETIIENTLGIELAGADNRNIKFDSVYQETAGEVTPWSAWVTFTGSGIGLSITNCYGGNKYIPYTTAWNDVTTHGNAAFSYVTAIAKTGKIIEADSGQLTTAAAGDFTADTIDIPPGTYLVNSVVATEDAGSGVITRLAVKLSTAEDSANLPETNANFVPSVSMLSTTPVTAGLMRLNHQVIYSNNTTATVTLYLRVYIGRTAGTIAYRSYITAAKMY